MICKACGDAFDWPRRLEMLREAGMTPKPGEERYCTECANELFRGVIVVSPAKLYSAGRAGPEEPSPWQENNVRHLEDG